MSVTPQSTFSLALIAALVEDIEAEGRPLSHLVPATVPQPGATSQWWDLAALGDTLMQLAEQQCVRQPDMFRIEAVAAPPPAAALASAVWMAHEWVDPALRLFPSSAVDALSTVAHAAVTHLITSVPATDRKAALSHAILQAMMDTIAQHRYHEKPRRNA